MLIKIFVPMCTWHVEPKCDLMKWIPKAQEIKSKSDKLLINCPELLINFLVVIRILVTQ